MYYHKDGKWRGPRNVLEKNSKVVFVCHDNTYVSLFRLTKMGDKFKNSDKVTDKFGSSDNMHTVRAISHHLTHGKTQPAVERDLSG